MGKTYWSDRMPSENFLHEGVDIWQPLSIRQRRQAPSSDDLVNLILSFLLSLGKECHSEEEGRDRRHGLEIGQLVTSST